MTNNQTHAEETPQPNHTRQSAKTFAGTHRIPSSSAVRNRRKLQSRNVGDVSSRRLPGNSKRCLFCLGDPVQRRKAVDFLLRRGFEQKSAYAAARARPGELSPED